MLRRLRSERLWLLLAGLVLASGYLWLAQFGVDLVDEGYFMELATRVMRGQLPYRDFDTYYTPAFFYAQAAVFSVFGIGVMPARVLMVGVRLASCLLLYRLTRRVAPWPFACLPPLVLIAMDVSTGSHPAWPALLGTLLMLELLISHTRHASGRLLLGAGLAAGAAFAFKQNVGAFAILGGLGYVVLSPRPQPGVWVVLARAGYAIVVAAAAYWLLAPGLNELLAASVWLPLVGGVGVVLLWSGRTSLHGALGRRGGPQGVFLEGALFSLGVGLATLVWLVPITLALGPSETPFKLFVGQLNTGALTFPLDALPRGGPRLILLGVWLPLLLSAVFRGPDRRLLAPLIVAVCASVLVPNLPQRVIALDALNFERPGTLQALEWLDVELGSVFLYLPALAAWTAVLVLVSRPGMPGWRLVGRRLAGVFGARASDAAVAWCLLVGVLAQLAVYPRSDTIHVLLAGTPLMVVGAWALGRVHGQLSRRLPRVSRLAVLAALLVVPVATILPHTYRRWLELVQLDPISDGSTYVLLGLSRAPVRVPEHTASELRDAITFVQQRTAPGDPLFVYPVAPMANVLADRPNPTRFNHFLPGALTRDDLHEVIDNLEQARPRFVLWDHGGVVFWKTTEPNLPLSDYIWRCYQQVAAFRRYLILERTC